MKKHSLNEQNCTEIIASKEQYSSFAGFLCEKMEKYSVTRSVLINDFGFSNYQVKEIMNPDNMWNIYTLPQLRLIIRCCAIFIDTIDELDFVFEDIFDFSILNRVPGFKYINLIHDSRTTLVEILTNNKEFPILKAENERQRFIIDRAYERDELLKDVINIIN